MTTLPRSGRYRTIGALLAVLLLTGLMLATGNCIYESNDDMVMIGLLAGKQGIVATPDAVFLALPLSALLHGLYAINGTVPWYGLLMYGLLICSGTIGLKIIISSRTIVAHRIIASLAFLGFYSYLIGRLNFASVSLMLWFVVIAAIAQANLDQKPLSSPTDILWGCLLGISHLIRPDIVLLSLAFSLPVVATFIVFPAKQRLVRGLLPLLIAILLANGTALVVRSSEEYRSYAKFNKIRAYFTDSAMSEPNAKTIQALIQTGWSRTDFFLAHNWWFHDAALFNVDRFTTFMAHNKEKTAAVSFKYSREAFNQHRQSLAIVALCLIALAFSSQWRREQSPQNSLLLSISLVATLAGFILLTAIRLPPRVALPLFAYFVLLGSIFLPALGGTVTSGKARRFSVLLACGTAILYLAAVNFQTLTKQAVVAKKIKGYTDSTLLQTLKMHGADTIFLSANARCASFYPEAANPLREYGDMVKINNFPMGWTIASPPYNVFLRDNGFVDRFTVVTRMINNPRLVIAFWESPDEHFELFAEQLQLHLRDHYSGQFPGMFFSVVPILDRRNVIGNFGWVFFTLQATPQPMTRHLP